MIKKIGNNENIKELLSKNDGNYFSNSNNIDRTVEYDYITTTSDWWLRSPGFRNISAACVMYGKANVMGNEVSNFSVCDRPILWLNLIS